MFKTGFLVLQRDCHNHCVFCDASRLGAGHVLSTDDALKVVDQYVSRGILQLIISGGEPLHHAGLAKVVAHARGRGIRWVSLFTTACFDVAPVGPDELEKAGLTSVMVSVFGPDAPIHDAVARTSGSFNQTVSGIQALSNKKFGLSVNTPVMRANYLCLHKILDQVILKHGIKYWMLSDIHPTTAVLQNENVHVSYNLLKPILSETVSEGQEHGVRISVQEYPLCILGDNLRLSQEINIAWYTRFISEYPFGSSQITEFAPFTSPSRVYGDLCRQCEARYYCRGVPSSYLKRYGEDFEYSPLRDASLHSEVREIAKLSLLRSRGIS